MKYGYIRAAIVLIAGLITLIVNIKTQKEVTLSLLILLIVLCIFYFIGTIAIELLQNSISKQENLTTEEEVTDTENLNEENEGDDNAESTVAFEDEEE